MNSRPKQSRNGSALLAVILFTTIAAILIGTGFQYTANLKRLAYRNDVLSASQAAAEGGIEQAFSEWRALIRKNYGTRLPTRNDFIAALPASFPYNQSLVNVPPPQADSTTQPAYHPDYAPYAFQQLLILPLDEGGDPVPNADDSPYVSVDNVPDRPGIRGSSAQYLVTSQTSRDTPVGPLTVTLQRTLQQTRIPLFQFAVFYDDLLEIHPGREFDLNGLVHTNRQLYAASKLLRVYGYTTMGDFYENNFAPGDSRRRDTATSPFTPPTFDQGEPQKVPTYNIMDVPADTLFDTSDANPNNDGYRELIEIPDAGYSDPPEIAQRRFYNQAHVRILVDSSTNPPGVTVVKGGSTIPADQQFYTNIKDSISHSIITDHREASEVYLTNVDVGKLGDAVDNLSRDSDPNYGFNGAIYITDTSAPADGSPSPSPDGVNREKAIRLMNGSKLPKGGLTIVSNNGIYLQGDYNTGGTGSEVPSNDTSNPDFTQPAAPGYEWRDRPAAVIGDAVMILSNNWNDSNSSLSLSKRIATPTTVNAAILSGIVPTGTVVVGTNPDGSDRTNYSGGAENFPRFLESWSNVDFTYYGSMVQLYHSEQFDSPWLGTGKTHNIYNAPARHWYFDTGFLTLSPPGTLDAVVYSRGRFQIVKRGPL